MTILDLLLIAKFLASPIFTYSPSRIPRRRSVRRTSTMPLATANRYKKNPISPGDLNIPSFEIPYIDSGSVCSLTGLEKDPLPLKSCRLFCYFLHFFIVRNPFTYMKLI